jgi:hypothetical protein
MTAQIGTPLEGRETWKVSDIQRSQAREFTNASLPSAYKIGLWNWSKWAVFLNGNCLRGPTGKKRFFRSAAAAAVAAECHADAARDVNEMQGASESRPFYPSHDKG